MRRVTLLSTFVLLIALVPATAVSASSDTLSVTSDTTLTEHFVGNVVIDADNVTLNCAGHTITGPGWGTGILVANRTGVSIKNCEVTGFEAGIEVASSSSTAVKHNHVYDNGSEGIGVGNSTENSFRDNTLTDNGTFGFLVLSADTNTFTDNDVSGHTGEQFHFASGSDGNAVIANTASGGEGGYVFLSSDSNLVKDNYATDYMFGGYGISEGSAFNVLRGNVADDTVGNGFGFTVNDSNHNNLIGNTSTGGVIGFSLGFGATDNTLRGNYAAGNSNIQFAVEGEPGLGSDRNRLIDNTAEGGDIGFFLRIASDNTLTGNTASGANGSGFGLQNGSNDNTLTNNTSHDSGFAGFSVSYSDGNTVSRNLAEENDLSGFFVFHSSDVTVDRNTSLDNRTGLFALVTDGATSVFSRNTACGNTQDDAIDVSRSEYDDPASWDRNDFCKPLTILDP